MNPAILVAVWLVLSVMAVGFAADVDTSTVSRKAVKVTPIPLPTFVIVTPAPSPSPMKCPKRLFRLGGACQCHLIKILAIQLFKRISFEGQIQRCLDAFGPKPKWTRACRKLTRSVRFKKKKSIRIVTRIVDKCGPPLCKFSVRV